MSSESAHRGIPQSAFTWLWLSLLAVIPCFWHPVLLAGDLSSHVYNAWLRQTLAETAIPGLEVVPRFTNVAFDFLLSFMLPLVGPRLLASVAGAIAVLCFFWGSWAFIHALTKRSPFAVFPCLLMFSYGWVFNSGFMNYYLSLAFAFMALALLVGIAPLPRFLALFPVCLCLLSHPLGFAWLLGGGLFLYSHFHAPRSLHFSLTGLFFVLLVLMACLLPFSGYDYLWSYYPKWRLNGLDQITLGSSYLPVVFILFLGGGLFFFHSHKSTLRASFLQLFESPLLWLYVLLVAVCLSQPSLLDTGLHQAPLGFIVERLSLISGILFCGLLCQFVANRFFLLFSACLSLFFFGLLYRDTCALSKLEAEARALLLTLPRHSRVVSSLQYRPGYSRLHFAGHLIDQASLGHVYSYSNYEASTGQFLLRASAPNPIVIASHKDAVALETGDYVVKAAESPLHQLFHDPVSNTLKLRTLHTGQRVP